MNGVPGPNGGPGQSGDPGLDGTQRRPMVECGFPLPEVPSSPDGAERRPGLDEAERWPGRDGTERLPR